MSVAPYLEFDGNCAEAFAFYAALFGGTIVHQSRFADMPAAEGKPALPEAARNRVMHVHLQLEGRDLMGSDTMPVAPGQDPAQCGGYQKPQGLWVSIGVANAAEGRRVFDGLAQGGAVAMPFAKTFWSEGFGMVTDRFGTPWMVNVVSAS